MQIKESCIDEKKQKNTADHLILLSVTQHFTDLKMNIEQVILHPNSSDDSVFYKIINWYAIGQLIERISILLDMKD